VRDHSYCKSYWTQIRNSHLANKQEGYSDVAYNFAVCRHGAVLEGRGIGFRTGANGNQALNADHDSVCVLYGTNDSSVSSAVVEGVRWVVQHLRDTGTGREIKGHRDGYATACPGDPLYALVKSGKFEPAPKEDTEVDAKDVWLYKGKGESSDVYAYVRNTKAKVDALEDKLDALIAAVAKLK
jgi:hypothetical protein